MGIITIGILDEEQTYVERLCAGLNRIGSGRWRALAFTQEAVLEQRLQKMGLQLVVATDIALLQRLQKQYEGFRYLWLTDDEKKEIKPIGRIYRYQGIHGVAKALRLYINRYEEGLLMQKPMIAVYSPVGRCGKTNLALSIARAPVEVPWLYIGLETYSSFREEQEAADRKKGEAQCVARPHEGEAFLFYVKTRQGDPLLRLLEGCNGILPTGRSWGDTRLLVREDISWFQGWFHKSSYGGAVFDIGTAVLQDIAIFAAFDRILVPYLCQERAEIKRQHFEQLLQAYGQEEVLQKLLFVDMSQKEEIAGVMDLVTGGRQDEGE